MRTTLFLIALLVMAGSATADVTFFMHYIDGIHGQVHVLTSRPEVASRSPMVCGQTRRCI